MSAPKTVKVRIAVSVDPSGNWFALGHPLIESHAQEGIHDSVDRGPCDHWVTAELPIPEALTVQGEVSDAGREPEEVGL